MAEPGAEGGDAVVSPLMPPIEFGTDGWRAIIGDEFTVANVRMCARAVADHLADTGLAAKGLVIGYDTRFGSERFAAAVAEVAAACGVPVALCSSAAPTPVVSYHIVQRAAGGAVIITASHNPGDYNGFKFRGDYGGAASPEMVAEVEERVRRIQRDAPAVPYIPLERAVAQGLVEPFDPAPSYFEQLGRLVDLPRLRDAGLTVAVDSMCGAGMGYIQRALGGGRTKVIEIRGERNPSFPDMHNPEPIARNLGPLVECVRREGADVGLATDGDADRIGLVDERGEYVDQLKTYALLLLYLLDVKGLRGPAVRSLTSTFLADRLGQRYGIPVYETAVGFKYVGPKMIETNAIMGGEESGGFAFAGHVPERDGILAGLFAVDLMAHRGRPFSGVLDYVAEMAGPSYYDRIDITFDSTKRAETLSRVLNATPETIDGSRVVAVNDTDGRKFTLEDGSWLLIRFSGTEPLLRIYTETTSADRVGRILSVGREIAGV